MQKIVSLHEEAIAVHAVRQVAQLLGEVNLLCNAHLLPKRLSPEKQLALVVELLSHDARPVVEHINGGPLRRAEVKGDGTKRSPYRAEWRNDYFVDV